MKVNKGQYFLDTVTLAFGAFGGPQAHIALLFDLYVQKRKYIDEKELIELNALCSFLPGPTSTQTITAIGYKIGGIRMALLTLIIWILPAAFGMILCGIFINHLKTQEVSLEFTLISKSITIGLIAYAAFIIYKKVVHSLFQKTLCFFTSFITIAILLLLAAYRMTAFIFPLLLIIGGISSVLFSKEKKLPSDTKKIKIKWTYLLLTGSIFVFSILASSLTTSHFLNLFERFYRNGCFVYGGGQVLIPLLQIEFVEQTHLMTNEDFLSGVSFASSMPGPLFSISGYLGSVASHELSFVEQIIGGFVGLTGIFLPGTLLIFFIFPVWNQLKELSFIRLSLGGVNAVASGFIIAVCLILFLSLNLSTTAHFSGNLLIVVGTFLVCLSRKVSIPLLMIGSIILGLFLF